MTRKIFVISGLGADHAVFHKLDLPGYELVHVKWVPTIKGESLGGYAKRLLPQITDENPILLGLSLGSMLVLEVAQLIETKCVISLSSITSYKELPGRYKFAGGLRLQKVLPVYWFAKGNRFTHWLFGTKNTADNAVLDEVFNRLDKDFLYWALNAVLSWDNAILPNNIVRIHGTADLVLPAVKRVKYDALIKGGTHLMLLDQHEEVSNAILNLLNKKLEADLLT